MGPLIAAKVAKTFVHQPVSPQLFTSFDAAKFRPTPRFPKAYAASFQWALNQVAGKVDLNTPPWYPAIAWSGSG